MDRIIVPLRTTEIPWMKLNYLSTRIFKTWSISDRIKLILRPSLENILAPAKALKRTCFKLVDPKAKAKTKVSKHN